MGNPLFANNLVKVPFRLSPDGASREKNSSLDLSGLNLSEKNGPEASSVLQVATWSPWSWEGQGNARQRTFLLRKGLNRLPLGYLQRQLQHQPTTEWGQDPQRKKYPLYNMGFSFLLWGWATLCSIQVSCHISRLPCGNTTPGILPGRTAGGTRDIWTQPESGLSWLAKRLGAGQGGPSNPPQESASVDKCRCGHADL